MKFFNFAYFLKYFESNQPKNEPLDYILNCFLPLYISSRVTMAMRDPIQRPSVCYTKILRFTDILYESPSEIVIRQPSILYSNFRKGQDMVLINLFRGNKFIKSSCLFSRLDHPRVAVLGQISWTLWTHSPWFLRVRTRWLSFTFGWPQQQQNCGKYFCLLV